MIIICYFLNEISENCREWIRLEVSEEIGTILCEKIWNIQDVKTIMNLNREKNMYKYVMCNEM